MKFSLAVFLIFILYKPSLSQSINPDDSLQTGKKYRIIFFNQKEIVGTVTSQTDKTITLNSGNKVSLIERNDILKISTDISPSKYKFLATLNAGVIPKNITGDDFASSFIINGRFSYFYSEKKSLGIDASFNSFKKNNYYNKNEVFGYDGYTGGDYGYIDLLVNAQIGTFDKSNIIDLYVNLGAGIQMNYINSSTSIYYSFFNSTLYTYNNSSSFKVYPQIQAGGGLIIKPWYNFGINAEFEIKGYGFGYLIFPREIYFPVKAGLSYYFMK